MGCVIRAVLTHLVKEEFRLFFAKDLRKGVADVELATGVP